MSMENIELISIETFGWTMPKKDGWWYLTNPTISKGWKTADVKKIAANLKSNVDVCYKTLLKCVIHDLDDDLNYTIFFDNSKKLFDMKLTDSDKAEVLDDQKKLMFKSDVFKRTALRAYEILERSKQMVTDVLDDHIEAGELLEVDEIKLEAIMDMLNDPTLMKNFKLRRYVR